MPTRRDACFSNFSFVVQHFIIVDEVLSAFQNGNSSCAVGTDDIRGLLLSIALTRVTLCIRLLPNCSSHCCTNRNRVFCLKHTNRSVCQPIGASLEHCTSNGHGLSVLRSRHIPAAPHIASGKSTTIGGRVRHINSVQLEQLMMHLP